MKPTIYYLINNMNYILSFKAIFNNPYDENLKKILLNKYNWQIYRANQ